MKEITVDLPFNNSLIDHVTYLVPDPGYQNCLSGTVTRTVHGRAGGVCKGKQAGNREDGGKTVPGEQ